MSLGIRSLRGGRRGRFTVVGAFTRRNRSDFRASKVKPVTIKQELCWGSGRESLAGPGWAWVLVKGMSTVSISLGVWVEVGMRLVHEEVGTIDRVGFGSTVEARMGVAVGTDIGTAVGA